MPDEETPPPSEGRPVLTGLIALIGVAVVVGLILGGGALAVTKVLGLLGTAWVGYWTRDADVRRVAGLSGS